MKNLNQWWNSLFQPQQEKHDHIKGCIELIFNGHSTGQSILIFSEVESLFIQKLQERKNNNNNSIKELEKDNQTIDNFFAPNPFKAKSIVLMDANFDKPIKTN